MPVDIVKEVTGLRRAYANKRGADRARGVQGAAVPGTLIPRTTWGDVAVAAQHIEKYADPSHAQCIEILKKHRGLNDAQARITCLSGSREINPSAFRRTSLFMAEKRRFSDYHPMAVGIKLAGFRSIPFVADKIAAEEIFPHNEEFWGFAGRLALARSAAGTVPFWSEVAVDSIKEAVRDLPDTIGGAIEAIDPGDLIPDVSGITEFLRWGTIAGGALLLAWYMYRSRKA